MALTNREIVRLGIGDTTEPYVLTDDQIDYFLTINSDDTSDAIEDAQVAMSQILAVQAVNIRTEDLWEDRRDQAKRYNESLEASNNLKGQKAYPIIGGSSTYKGSLVDQFDVENNYEGYPERDEFEDN